MSRPTRFEHNRYLGDKRTQRLYDLDQYGVDDEVTKAVDEIMAAETFLVFGPDTIDEARNRSYKPSASLRRSRAAADAD